MRELDRILASYKLSETDFTFFEKEILNAIELHESAQRRRAAFLDMHSLNRSYESP
jgi:hypothetical protein